jgi:hypothetical protein
VKIPGVFVAKTAKKGPKVEHLRAFQVPQKSRFANDARDLVAPPLAVVNSGDGV